MPRGISVGAEKLIIAAGACGFATGAPAGGLVFEDRSDWAGLTGGHAAPNDHGMQFMAGGAAAGDFDRDGDQDLFVPGGPAGVDQLYINNGDGTFAERAARWGVDAPGMLHTGVSVGDYDADGWLDLYVTAVIVQSTTDTARNRLYRNNADGTFTDVAEAAGVQTPAPLLNDSLGSAFGDYDLDGDLDLYVAGWTGGNRLYRNEGDGSFTTQPDAVFIADVPDTVRGFAPRFCDVSGDGWPDLLLTADFGTGRVYINNADGTFTNATQAWGAGLASNAMGSAQGDFNNDGLLDWYVTSLITQDGSIGSGNMLYVNLGGVFDERSVKAGVNAGEWGWGADAADFNHDGWLDIAATNGWSGPFFEDDPTHLWINLRDDGCRFEDAAAAGGITHTAQGRGLLTFDADLDGDRDLLIASHAAPLTYYRNELPDAASSAITLRFDTSGEPSLAPDGFGVRVELDTGGLTQVRYLDGGNNFVSQSELSTHFGLGDAPRAEEIRITWPGGETTTLAGVQPGRYTITARLACEADWTTDGVLDLADVQAWLADFHARHPQADLTADGAFDTSDAAAFTAGFVRGCR
jgi:hypothetical protein